MFPRIILALSLVLVTGINPVMADDSLYQQFGGKEGLTQIVDDTLRNALSDSRIGHFFANIDQVKFKANVVDHFCVVLDGPCQYTGHTMHKIHQGLGIREADFNALVEDLEKAMSKNNIAERAQNKLLARIAPMYRDMIEK